MENVLFLGGEVGDIASMINYDDYNSYFKGIAEQHTGICHGQDGRKSFFRISIQDAIMGCDRVGINCEAHVLELIDPHYRHSHAQQGQAYRDMEGGFQILKKHKDGDEEGQRLAIASSQGVAEDILLLMAAHSRGGHPLFARTFDNAENSSYQIVTYQRDGNWAGVRVIFNVSQHRDWCIRQSAWKDDLLENEYFPLNEQNCII